MQKPVVHIEHDFELPMYTLKKRIFILNIKFESYSNVANFKTLPQSENFVQNALSEIKENFNGEALNFHAKIKATFNFKDYELREIVGVHAALFLIFEKYKNDLLPEKPTGPEITPFKNMNILQMYQNDYNYLDKKTFSLEEQIGIFNELYLICDALSTNSYYSLHAMQMLLRENIWLIDYLNNISNPMHNVFGSEVVPNDNPQVKLHLGFYHEDHHIILPLGDALFFICFNNYHNIRELANYFKLFALMCKLKIDSGK